MKKEINALKPSTVIPHKPTTKCGFGYKDMCCCQCDSLLEIDFSHSQSSIPENYQLEGWICILPFSMEGTKSCFYNKDGHGCCECFTDLDKNEGKKRFY